MEQLTNGPNITRPPGPPTIENIHTFARRLRCEVPCGYPLGLECKATAVCRAALACPVADVSLVAALCGGAPDNTTPYAKRLAPLQPPTKRSRDIVIHLLHRPHAYKRLPGYLFPLMYSRAPCVEKPRYVPIALLSNLLGSRLPIAGTAFQRFFCTKATGKATGSHAAWAPKNAQGGAEGGIKSKSGAQRVNIQVITSSRSILHSPIEMPRPISLPIY